MRDSSRPPRVPLQSFDGALGRHIIDLHGGDITAQSEGLGKGATFTITIPLQAHEIGDMNPSKSPAHQIIV